MREVLNALDRLGLRWFVTGSEAAGCYGVLRQTFDLDLVVDTEPTGWNLIVAALPDFSIADPIQYQGFAMGSVVSIKTAAKVDLIMRARDAYLEQVMARRQPCEHHSFGQIWVCSLEDLIVAKLEWSEGTSELQLRDCSQLIRVNGPAVDWRYLDRAAGQRGVGGLLGQLRNAT